jgi:hypothetical protein
MSAGYTPEVRAALDSIVELLAAHYPMRAYRTQVAAVMLALIDEPANDR